jgi:transcriptional regulator with XRE-family HTH domain
MLIPKEPTDLHRFIAKRRAEIPGLTQAKLAHAIGIKVGEYISLVESGQRRIPLERIPRLADALSVDRIWLIKWAFSEEYPLCYRLLFHDEATKPGDVAQPIL